MIDEYYAGFISETKVSEYPDHEELYPSNHRCQVQHPLPGCSYMCTRPYGHAGAHERFTNAPKFGFSMGLWYTESDQL